MGDLFYPKKDKSRTPMRKSFVNQQYKIGAKEAEDEIRRRARIGETGEANPLAPGAVTEDQIQAEMIAKGDPADYVGSWNDMNGMPATKTIPQTGQQKESAQKAMDAKVKQNAANLSTNNAKTQTATQSSSRKSQYEKAKPKKTSAFKGKR